jgi:hypothetical protein
MHYVGVIVSGENISGSAHICCELINFIEASINDFANGDSVTQVANHKVVSVCLGELGKFQVNAADPEAVAFEALHEVATYETAGSAHQCRFHDNLHTDASQQLRSAPIKGKFGAA